MVLRYFAKRFFEKLSPGGTLQNPSLEAVTERRNQHGVSEYPKPRREKTRQQNCALD